MNILIFEDEIDNGEHLIRLIKTLRPQYTILGVLPSVAAGIEYFQKGIMPDLVFMDIHLADESSFHFFETTKLEFPVIFTTAFDKYALRAFKVNSIDYLMKPIEKQELEKSIEKFEKLLRVHVPFTQIVKFAEGILQKQNQRFSARVNDQLIFVKVQDIAYIFSIESSTWAVPFSGMKVPLDYSLDHLEKMLDTSVFFRINRKYIVRLEAIKKIEAYFNNRYVLSLTPEIKDTVIVSRERSAIFKNWVEGNG
jgi:two-component system, LytTR family, response regulator LytT